MKPEDFNKQWDTEGELLKKVTEWLAPQVKYGIRTLRINDLYARGYSDLFICVRGIFVCAELKDNTGTASPHQKLFLQQMRDANAVVGICRSIADVSALINEAVERVEGDR